jgi:two-component system response regulator CpxR
VTVLSPETGETRVLIVDDDEGLCRLIGGYLQPLGYRVDVEHDGLRGLARALGTPYAAIVLDVRLPRLNGIEVLRRLRETSRTPVLMLSSLSGEGDKVAGLEIGADDYLEKGASLRELLARLRALIRRSTAPAAATPVASIPEPPVSLRGLTLDPGTRGVDLDGRNLALTATEFDILHLLVRVPGRVRTREELLSLARERDFEPFDRSIDVHVAALRKKLGDDATAPRFIETVRGVGYRIRART